MQDWFTDSHEAFAQMVQTMTELCAEKIQRVHDLQTVAVVRFFQ
ncbi:hypothetical protein SAMN05216345_10165 [Cupriavidus sp. YR651]|nr:hypothetical protein [Cupriavidus sp. YR651]SDB98929.1 hypothetical protein SAMN05216345_10165 [Cupriavidus sp. YR651]